MKKIIVIALFAMPFMVSPSLSRSYSEVDSYKVKGHWLLIKDDVKCPIELTLNRIPDSPGYEAVAQHDCFSRILGWTPIEWLNASDSVVISNRGNPLNTLAFRYDKRTPNGSDPVRLSHRMRLVKVGR